LTEGEKGELETLQNTIQQLIITTNTPNNLIYEIDKYKKNANNLYGVKNQDWDRIVKLIDYENNKLENMLIILKNTSLRRLVVKDEIIYPMLLDTIEQKLRLLRTIKQGASYPPDTQARILEDV
jgi:hypothetical protein